MEKKIFILRVDYLQYKKTINILIIIIIKIIYIIYRVMLIDTFYVTNEDVQFQIHHTYCHKYQFLESIEKKCIVFFGSLEYLPVLE